MKTSEWNHFVTESVVKPFYNLQNVHVEIEKLSPLQNEEVVVNATSSNKTKKYFCKYCKLLFSKLTVHLERIHNNEEEVKKFMVLPKGMFRNERFFVLSLICCSIIIWELACLFLNSCSVLWKFSIIGYKPRRILKESCESVYFIHKLILHYENITFRHYDVFLGGTWDKSR